MSSRSNADVRDVDVLFVGQPDAMTPLGTKGVGELAIIGMAAAIANAVYHATGTRFRSLPISIEKVLGHEPPARASVRRSTRVPEKPEARATRLSERLAGSTAPYGGVRPVDEIKTTSL